MCTSVIIGRKATRRGVSILARNEDFETNICNKYLKYRHTPQYIDADNGEYDTHCVSEGIWTLGNGLAVPVPNTAYRYSAMPDANAFQEATCAIGDHFYFEERGVNENNVALSATNSLEDPNEKALAADPFVIVGVSESIIPTLILPQATSAKNAVTLLGKYVEQYGASEGNGVLFGDLNESWYMEIGSGHHWIAVRVPDEQYVVIANGKRIHGVSLNSPETLCSDGLFSFTQTHSLLDDPVETDFNFAKAFGQPGIPYNIDRVWLGQLHLTPSLKQAPRLEHYPLFLKPDVLVTEHDVMTLLRANYDGTALEGLAQRPIGVIRTAESHLIVFDSTLPAPLRCVIWQSVSSPLNAPYFPLFESFEAYPNAYQLGNKTYVSQSAYWAFKGLSALASVNGNVSSKDINAQWYGLEQQFLNEHSTFVDGLRRQFDISPDTAMQSAANYSLGVSTMLIEKAHSLYNETLTEMVNKMEDPHEIRKQ
ncbi:C69 family dipeptidase [Vibrio ostreicida]|uniref:Dipeptidase n=1 Tax=Vibrio ostreicida TaxID=526588 RepID=A0ABT8BWG1_9VIBR|nr:C69 family dipeptidase [Vibrio ostreicida]MDN3610420.1 C69 family dipeptidase [Vibrio ostreicida]NPD07571.1 C69 family dipeptidase [Vibrio ostreicida]